MAEDSFRILAIVTSAHGVHGRVKLKIFTEHPKSVTAYGPLRDEKGQSYRLKITGEAAGMPVASIEGITERNEAEKLRGLALGVDRSALPEPEEGVYYLDDLIGLRVELEDGALYGTIRSIQNYGAGDIAEITLEGGKIELLPFSDEVFPVIDVAAKRLVVRLPEILKTTPEAGE